MNLKKFDENLNGLMIVNNLNPTSLAKCLGVSVSTVCRYLQGNREPSFKNLVGLANLFNCSVDYLLGFNEYGCNQEFLPCPKFSVRLQELVNSKNLSGAAFCREAKIPEGNYFDWKNDKRLPEPDGLIALAKYFDCTVDCVLGREK